MRKTVALKTLSGFIASILVCILLCGCGTGHQDSSLTGGSLPEDGIDEQSDTAGNPADDPMGRQVLTLVMSFPSWEDYIWDHIRDFNENNPSYFVEVRYYTEDVRDDVGEILSTQLPLEILSGKGPDLVLWNGNYPTLTSDQLMEDLNVFMDADPDFHRKDYFENVIQAFERDGCLYTLPVSFAASTLCGRREELGEDRGITQSWEMGEMLEAYRNSPHAELFSEFPNREYTLHYIGACLIDNYVDWDSGECYFDSSAFVEFLEFCKGLPDGFENIPESICESYQKGETFLHRVILNSPWDMTNARAYFGDEELLWPGWPVPDGEKASGGVLVDGREAAFSICKNSNSQEGAWEFIKSWLTADVQRQVEGNPLLCSVFEERIQEALEVEHETVDGIEQEKLRYEVIMSEEDGSMWFSCITEEEADLYRSLIESASRGPGNDYSILEIIEEEAGAYFENDKDAAAVADTIQHRVSVYVSEWM